MNFAFLKTKYPRAVAVVLAFSLVVLAITLTLKLTLLSPTYVKKNIATRDNAVLIQKDLAKTVNQNVKILPDVEPVVAKVLSENNVTQLLELSVAHIYTTRDFSETLDQTKKLLKKTLTSTSLFGDVLSTTITNLIFPSMSNYLSDNLEAPLTQAQKIAASAKLFTTVLIVVCGLLSLLCLTTLLVTRRNILRLFGVSLAGFALLFLVINLFFWQNIKNQLIEPTAFTTITQEFLATSGHQLTVSSVILIIFGGMFCGLSFLSHPNRQKMS